MASGSLVHTGSCIELLPCDTSSRSSHDARRPVVLASGQLHWNNQIYMRKYVRNIYKKTNIMFHALIAP